MTRTIHCTHCNIELPSSADYCTKCAKLVSTGKKFCIECGEGLAEGQVFCKKCGKGVGKIAKSKQSTYLKKYEVEKTSGLSIVGVVLLIVSLIFLLMAAFNEISVMQQSAYLQASLFFAIVSSLCFIMGRLGKILFCLAISDEDSSQTQLEIQTEENQQADDWDD